MKKILEKTRLYLKVRYSWLIHNLWLLLRADVRKEITAKKELYNSVLPKECKLIFDIGANEGALTEIFSKHARQVVAVEPSERNLAILCAKFKHRKDIIIVPKAVSNQNGFEDWYADSTDYAMGTLNRKWNDSKHNRDIHITRIETETLDELIKQYGDPDYIKIDVEGHELKVLQGLHKRISLLSFEAILPLFQSETISCIDYLLTINPDAMFNYSNGHTPAYKTFQASDVLLNDIKRIDKTIDIFCRL